ncbi:MAG: hypothetical protein Q4C71_05665 [Microbacteriaceae bacterium]|nr:hypothetical protein [Microbacteriaceae bacterium]
MAVGEVAEIPGRTLIAAKALTRLVSAVAASELGVPVKKVQANISDAAGRLAVRISAPIALAPLGGRAALPGNSVPLLVRAENARHEVASRVAHLSGREVVSTVIHFTGAELEQKRRVR